MNNSPQTKNDLKNFSRVDVPIMTHLHAVRDGKLLKSIKQVFPIPLDKDLRAKLCLIVEENGISFTMAMEAMLMTWFEELAAKKDAQEDIRKGYPHLSDFRASFHVQKKISWVKAQSA